MHHPSLSCRQGAPRHREPQQLVLSCTGVRIVPAAPTRGSPSLPLSSPASRGAHTGAPARGRAGGGGRCCPSLSPSRADRPPCCGSRDRLTLSLSPQLSTVSRRSGGGDPDGDASGAAGWSEPGSERRAPAYREQAAWLGRSPSAPDSAEGFGQCDVAVLLLGGGQGRLLQLLCRHRQPPIPSTPKSSDRSRRTRLTTLGEADAKSEVCSQHHQLPREPLGPLQPAPAPGAMRPQPGGAPSANSPPMGSAALGRPTPSA